MLVYRRVPISFRPFSMGLYLTPCFTHRGWPGVCRKLWPNWDWCFHWPQVLRLQSEKKRVWVVWEMFQLSKKSAVYILFTLNCGVQTTNSFCGAKVGSTFFLLVQLGVFFSKMLSPWSSHGGFNHFCSSLPSFRASRVRQWSTIRLGLNYLWWERNRTIFFEIRIIQTFSDGLFFSTWKPTT